MEISVPFGERVVPPSGGYEWVGSDEALTSYLYSQDASVRALREEPGTGLERGYSRSDLLPYIIQTKGRHIFLGLLWFVQSFVSTGPLHSRWVVSFGIHCLHHSGTLAIILCRWSNMLTLALHKDPSGAVSSLCELKNPADSYLV